VRTGGECQGGVSTERHAVQGMIFRGGREKKNRKGETGKIIGRSSNFKGTHERSKGRGNSGQTVHAEISKQNKTAGQIKTFSTKLV